MVRDHELDRVPLWPDIEKNHSYTPAGYHLSFDSEQVSTQYVYLLYFERNEIFYGAIGTLHPGHVCNDSFRLFVIHVFNGVRP